MRKWLIIGAIGAALTSGLLVGVSHAGGGGITEPAVLVLDTGNCGDPGARCRYYPMEADGRSDGQIVAVNVPVVDVDGEAAGRMREVCTYVGRERHSCTQVFALRAGPHTERGTVVTTGILGEWVEGVNGEFAVTGGTGAYANVRGYAVKVYDGDDFIFTVHLIP